MMKTITHKLKNNRGASMILVLALFLFCVMVSSVILAAAASGTSRATQRTTQQQSYLAVSSATDLIVEELMHVSPFVGHTLHKEYGCIDCNVSADTVNWYWLDSSLIPDSLNVGYMIHIEAPHGPTENEKYADALTSTSDSILDELVNRAAAEVYRTSSLYFEEFAITMDDEEGRLPDVICKFTMDVDYKIFIEITADGSDYTVVVESLATLKETKSIGKAEGSTFGCTHPIFYKELLDSGEFVDRYEDLYITGEITDYTTTIKWNQPEITKGVAEG